MLFKNKADGNRGKIKKDIFLRIVLKIDNLAFGGRFVKDETQQQEKPSDRSLQRDAAD